MKKGLLLVLMLAIVSLGIAACGGGSGDDEGAATTEKPASTTGGGGGGGETVKLTADPSGAFKFEQPKLAAKEGKVTIDFENPATLAHDVVVERTDGTEVGRVEPFSKGKKDLTLDVSPGEYDYYCDVPGHREGGMEGTLTVK